MMLYALYVPKKALSNIPVGVAAGVWGLPDGVVANQLKQLTPVRSAGDVLQALQVGDYVLAASNGPSPRVPKGGWAKAVIDDGELWRVTRPHFRSRRRVWPVPAKWPSERYADRFGIETVRQYGGLDGTNIGVDGMDALWYSANNRGVVLPLPGPTSLMTQAGEPVAGAGEDPAVLLLEGELDAKVPTKVRREQAKLRARLIGMRAAMECSICDRLLPVGCLRAAHIKRRSKCGARERRQMSNLMLACTLGCDHLFELGRIYVDARGKIRVRRGPSTTPDLDAVTSALAGKACKAHTRASAPYFAWHRANLSP
jgi:hypothetical protein